MKHIWKNVMVMLCVSLLTFVIACGKEAPASTEASTKASSDIQKNIQILILDGASGIEASQADGRDTIDYVMKQDVKETAELSRKRFKEHGFTMDEVPAEGAFLFSGSNGTLGVEYTVSRLVGGKGETSVHISYKVIK
ncbi:hypothetical protein HZF08_19385 [Paenibacillus sp. CGMCC 1.16610]|uniref:DUF4783 domain-containing protein n=1 Tax=Paenibacillus anseongense TaxID=2682845 RepID=A0ABW9UCS7_9BACL|nr:MULTISPECIES: hypothetical protein [Paenibacillus]MBA2940463.1 hypothetical protein [Paenibacillus sp. CGMCC 1.16610]MVQ35640.1 hypothetical protein [Paenibacillus anseongense]